MEAGKFIEEYILKDGRKLIIRTPQLGDIDNYFLFINNLIDEDVPLLLDEKVSYTSELYWIYNKILNMFEGREIAICIEYNGKIVADAAITQSIGREKHVGSLGIAIAKEFRNMGLGYKLISMLLEYARSSGFKIIKLTVYSNNGAGIHLYEKLGFKEAGRIPKVALFKKEGFVDVITMYKEL